MRWHDVSWGLLALSLCTSAFVDLRVVHGDLDVPVADLAGMALAGSVGVWALVHAGPKRILDVLRAPAPGWYALFVVACVASRASHGGDDISTYFILRKPVFVYVVFAIGVHSAVATLRRADRLLAIAAVYVILTSLAGLPVALRMLINGWVSATEAVPGLINNHKVLAVAVAPWLAALAIWRAAAAGRLRDLVDVALVLGTAAVVASVSRTAWITVLFGAIGFARIGGWRLIERPALAAAGVALLAVAMATIPFVTGAAYMADAFDSRMSLNLRAWEMFSAYPLLGAGPGNSVRYTLEQAPHWRINGVDAHGVVQKLAAEVGLLGLGAWLAFTATVLARAWRASFGVGARPDPAVLGATALILGLHVNLLLSTEYFSSSHWVPLAIGLGVLTAAERDQTGTS